MNPKLKSNITESLAAVLPISLLVLGISIFLVPVYTGPMMLFLVGAVMLILGMGMFQLGAQMAMSPIGEGIGVQLSRTKSITIAALISALMGLIITIAEPDLQVLSEQVPAVPNMTLILTVAVGVGIFLALAVLRIWFKIDLSYLLIGFYGVMLLISFFVPRDFLAVAFDSGGVTTGPMTVPFIMAMGVGLSAMRSDKNATSDSFGLVALSSVGPILAVMALGIFYRPTQSAYTGIHLAEVATTRDVIHAFAAELPRYAEEVAVSLLPIAAMFLIFQLFTRRWHKQQIRRMLFGFLYTYLGLVFFLCGVNVGFAPVGFQLGESMASTAYRWLLIPIGMAIGYFIVKAEPAIQILNHQVQTVTNGAISAKSMNRALSIGVAVSVGLAMLRVLTGLSIYAIVLPGYILALTLSCIVPKMFVGIAFDSGGVASGPMTSTFLLPLCIGACTALGGNIMTDAFGAVALVALTPLIAIQIMGVRYRLKLAKLEREAIPAAQLPTDLDDIIELEVC